MAWLLSSAINLQPSAAGSGEWLGSWKPTA